MLTLVRRFIIFPLIVIVFLGNSVHAQQTSSLLMLQISGDLWAWNGTQSGLIRRTSWGFNQTPIVSPDGFMTAYKSTASVAVDVIKKSGPVAGGDLPSNIWIMSTATGDAVRVADQPTDASFMQPDRPDKFIIRSIPAWSPDGKFLAWTQLVLDGDNASSSVGQLVIYDLEQKTEQVIVAELPGQYGTPSALPVAWGDTGIAVWSITGKTDPTGKTTVDDTLLVYDGKGNLLNAIPLASLYEYAWIKDAGKEYLGVLAKSPSSQQVQGTQWLLVEATSGRIFAMPGVPEMYSLLSPDGASVYPASMGTAPDWQIAAPDGSSVKLGNIDDVYAFTHSLTIAPDGQQVAYLQQGAAFVFAKGKASRIAPSDVSALGWGPTGWRVRRKTG